MRQLLPFLVVGLTAGSLYGLAALGLVLTYRTSGVFNFAHGALGAGAAYLFYTLHWTWGWPWPVAVIVSVALLGGVAGVIVERLTRSLVDARVATIIVATIGLLLFIQGFLYWRYGVERRISPDFLPTGTVLTIEGVKVSWAQAINFGVGVASLIGLYLLLHKTRLGIAMRGVVASPDLLGLAGTSPAGVRIASWAIGSSFAALTGILITPSILGMDAFLLSALVVQAFGAVAIGRFTSLPWTYVGGLSIGALAAISAKYLTKPPLTGLPNVIPFLVLIVVMLVTPKRKLPAGTGRFAGAAPRRALPVGRPVRIGAVAGGVALLLAIPKLVDTRISVYTSALALVVLFLSLSLLTRVSGQISLAHAAFAGVGAATFSKLAAPVHGNGQFGGLGTDTHGGVPWLVALIGAGLVTAAVGALLALPAMRLSGIYLALATFGFSQLMDNVVFQSWLMFGGSQGTLAGLRAPRPSIGSLNAANPETWYYIVLAVVGVCCVALVLLRRSRLGRFLRAIADSPTALTTLGLGVNVTRVLVFAVSAFFAGIAGALFAMQIGRVNYISFPAVNSLLYLAILTVTGAVSGYVTSAFLAAFFLAVMPSYLTSITFEIQSMLFGGIAVAAALISDRVGVGAALRNRLSGWLGRAATQAERRRGQGVGPARARQLEAPAAYAAAVDR
jgi:branched-subunit amino acid ABC-type transport system permease component